MFDGLGIVKKIINDREVQIYTVEDRKNIIVSATKDYILSIKDEIEKGEVIIIYYDKERKKINEEIEEI